MRFRPRWGIVFVSWLALAAPAHAAFPGRNGILAIQPLHGRGLIVVRATGADQRRICTEVSVCGVPRRPRFSPDGRAIVYAGPAIHIIGIDGSCMNCQFGVSANPAFRPGGTLVTFVSGGAVLEDGIDGLRQAQMGVGVRGISDAVWSASGELGLVARGRVWIGNPGRLRSIGPGSAPSWSPDGSRLVIVRGGWITIIRASNGAARRLVRGTAPAFSPDGRWVAFIDLQHQVRVIRSAGGRTRAVGMVRGVAVDWQPLPAHPAACVAPAGSKVIARSAQAVVTTNASAGTGGGGLPDTAAMGCLFADGRERVLERSTFNSVDDATNYPVAAVGGTYAAIASDHSDEHYGGDSESVVVFDLRTGERSGFGGESSSCEPFAPTCSGIDRLVVGADGISAVHVNGGPVTHNSDPLQVLCASEALCLATNNFGDVLSSTSPTQSPWSPATGASMNNGGAGGGSCPSVSLCVLVAGPSIFTSTDPSAGSWTTTRLAGFTDFLNVDCATTSLCVATTLKGQVAVSTDPTGGASAWSLENVDGDTPMYGISCPTTSECIATDLAGNVITSTNPTGGAAAWTVRNVAPRESGLLDVTCPSTSLCVATQFLTDVAVSTNPISGSWTSTKLTNPAGLSCPSTSLCVEVGGDSIGFSTDPASGTWSSYTIGGTPVVNLQTVSCPTTRFCVAAGNGDGHVLVSTNPTGGASTWTPVFADKIDCAIASGACGTEQIIASDRTGVHVLDNSTEFEVQTGPQLTGLALNADTLTWEDHGSRTSAQLTP
jgi:hypothetical protein